MPYFPPTTAPHRYWCPRCEAWYEVPRVAVSCCAIHAPGSCCHMGETRVIPTNATHDGAGSPATTGGTPDAE